MGFIKRAWKGEEKLWEGFWLYWLLFVGVITFFAIALLQLGFVSLPFEIFFLLFATWVSVSLWRCARNTNNKVLTGTAYLLSTLAFLLSGLLAVIVFGMTVYLLAHLL